MARRNKPCRPTFLATTGGTQTSADKISVDSSDDSCFPAARKPNIPSMVSSGALTSEVPSVASESFVNPNIDTIRKVFSRDRAECWACRLKVSLEIVHVSSSEMSWFNLYQCRGLISFTHPAHEDNLIPLCKNCGDQLNSHGWLFLPTSLSVFIDYEEADYKDRSNAAKMGHVVPPRTVPTTAGTTFFYTRYIMNPDFTTPISKQWPWAGSPTAAILKAASGVMSPTGVSVPAIVREEFAHLMNLYNRPDPLPCPRSTAHVGQPVSPIIRPSSLGNIGPTHCAPLEPTDVSPIVPLTLDETLAFTEAVHSVDLPIGTTAPVIREPTLVTKCQDPKCTHCDESATLRSFSRARSSGSAPVIPEDSISQKNRPKPAVGIAAPPPVKIRCQDPTCSNCKEKNAMPKAKPMTWGPESSSKDKMIESQQLFKQLLREGRTLNNLLRVGKLGEGETLGGED